MLKLLALLLTLAAVAVPAPHQNNAKRIGGAPRAEAPFYVARDTFAVLAHPR